jgi:hypothetical protein
MKQLNLIDKDLQKLSYNNCSISILLASDGYCFSVKDDIGQRCMALVCIPGTPEPELVKQSYADLLSEIWDEPVSVNVRHLAYAERKTVVSPAVFADDEQVKDIMEFHFPNQMDSLCLKQNFDSYCFSYLVSEKDHQSFVEFFKPQKVSHLAVPLLRTGLKYAAAQETDSVYMQVWKDYFDLIVIREKKLALYNTYRYKSGNDIVYFVLNAYKQLILDPKTCPLMISGWIEKNDNAVVKLNKFIRNMYFETLNPEKKYSYRFQETLPHYFIHFLNLD